MAILHTECEVRPSSSNNAATVELVTAMTLCLRSPSADYIARTVNVSLTSSRISNESARA